MSTVTIYTTPTCAPCRAAKSRLTREGIAYKTVDLSKDAEALAGLKERLDVAFVQTPLFEWQGRILNITDLSTIIAEHKTGLVAE